jgi:hypothetical protein
MEIFLGAIVLWVIPIFVAASMGKARNRSGVAYGILLGWLGVIIVALLPPRTNDVGPDFYRECPFCKEEMRRDASVCPHCRYEVEPLVLRDGRWYAADGSFVLDEETGDRTPVGPYPDDHRYDPRTPSAKVLG